MSDNTKPLIIPKQGDVWLLSLKSRGVTEVEVVAVASDALKLLDLEHHFTFWCKKKVFRQLAVCRIGRFEYQKRWFGRRKKVFFPEGDQ